MVLADLIAAELPTEIQPAIPPVAAAAPAAPQPAPHRGEGRRSRTAPPSAGPSDHEPLEEAHRLRTTVGQLEHALTARIRIEQAIGVLAERHRLRPREAFDLLRGAARSRGQKITDMAGEVVASTANPLLRLPDELARQAPAPKQRGLRRR